MAVSNETPIIFSEMHPGAYKFIHICETGIVPVILVIAVVTNILCLAVLPRTKMVSSFKTSLVALAVSDLLYAFFSFIQMMLELIAFGGDMPFGIWSKEAVATYAFYFVSNTYLGVSASIVISIVFIRHSIVTKPLTARKKFTPRRIRIISLCLFLANIILFTPTVFTVVWQSCYNTPSEPTCVHWNTSVPNFEAVAKYYPYTLTVLYGPAMVIIYVICFVGIHSTLKKANKNMDAIVHRKMSAQATEMRIKRTSRTTRTLIFILILDIICLIPICVQGLALVIAPKETVFSETNAPYKVFDTIGEVVTAMRPAYNFWLYAFTQRQFRSAMKKLCGCRSTERTSTGKEVSSSQCVHVKHNVLVVEGTPIMGRGGQVTFENSVQLTDDEADSDFVEETKL